MPSRAREHRSYCRDERSLLFGGAHRETSEGSTFKPHICEESSRVFVEVQEGVTFSIEGSGPRLAELRELADARKHGIQELQGVRGRVFHAA